MASPAKDLPSAVVIGDAKSVKRLLDEGADISHRTKDGMSAIGLASFWGYADIVELLLQHGAEVDSRNSGTLWTPLHCATFQGHGPVVMKLLKHKPELDATDMRGRTPIDFASANDAIWPFFNALGCKRTPKSELLKMDIVYQATYETTSDGDSIGGYDFIKRQFSNAGHRHQTTAAVMGDVLADEDDNSYLNKNQAGPSFSAYQS